MCRKSLFAIAMILELTCCFIRANTTEVNGVSTQGKYVLESTKSGFLVLTRVFDRQEGTVQYFLSPDINWERNLNERTMCDLSFKTIEEAFLYADTCGGQSIKGILMEPDRLWSCSGVDSENKRFVQLLVEQDWDCILNDKTMESCSEGKKTTDLSCWPQTNRVENVTLGDYLFDTERIQLTTMLSDSSVSMTLKMRNMILDFLRYYKTINYPHTNAGQLGFAPSSFDFGERTEIERPVLTATLRNDGERTVHVTDVIRTCVCANLELSTTNLPPGGAAEVRCTLDPNVFSGPFLKTFFIKTDDPAAPSITVPIRGSVRQLWEVSPDKWHQMRAGETNAILRVKAAPDAPALVRTEILGPAGASFELRPAGERVFDAVFTPGDQPRGQHHWTVNLYPEGAKTPALGLHLGAQVGEHWKCVPARLRAPADGRDFVADLLVKPANGKDLPADVDPAAITISPEWDHVAIEPIGPPTWRGIPLRLTVGAEMVSSWEFPKTFYITVPNHGAASVYFEKIVQPFKSESTIQ